MILDEILAHKRKEVEALSRMHPVPDAWRTPRTDCRGFADALSRDGMSLIAELKKASPSAGVIRKDFDPPAIAKTYQQAGAAALSVLTDQHYFQGCLDHMKAVRAAVALPVLRKDFIIDDYQVYESAAAGADAILLIVRALEEPRLRDLLTLAGELGMDALVESHSRDDPQRALAAGARIVGVNNRDLATFTTDIDTTIALAPVLAGNCVFVSESGIKTRADVERLVAAGVQSILIGETLLRHDNLATAARQLLGKM